MLFDNNNLIKIAYVVKPHGLDGHVSIKLLVDISQKYFQKDRLVFLLKEGLPVPFFIENYKTVGGGTAIKLKHISDEATALKFRSCPIYIIEEEQIIEEINENEFEYLGFDVFDNKHGHIGKIVNYNPISGNPVFETEINGKIIIIPFVSEFISEINLQSKTLFINAPDGLIDLYLEE